MKTEQTHFAHLLNIEPIHVGSVSLNVTLNGDHQMLNYQLKNPLTLFSHSFLIKITFMINIIAKIGLITLQYFMLVIKIHIETQIDHMNRFIMVKNRFLDVIICPIICFKKEKIYLALTFNS